MLCGCDDSGPIVRCPVYNHIVEDEMHFHIDYDSISLFLFADEIYWAPISYTHYIDEELTDSLIVRIYAYGQSNEPEPDPYNGHVWYSDSLVIWYSWRPIDTDLIESHFRPFNRTPPCPGIEFYRIDYIQLRHSDDLVVSVDSTVR